MAIQPLPYRLFRFSNDLFQVFDVWLFRRTITPTRTNNGRIIYIFSRGGGTNIIKRGVIIIYTRDSRLRKRPVRGVVGRLN